MKAALRDSISVHTLIPKVSIAAHSFFSKALGMLIVLTICEGQLLGRTLVDSNCKTTAVKRLIPFLVRRLYCKQWLVHFKKLPQLTAVPQLHLESPVLVWQLRCLLHFLQEQMFPHCGRKPSFKQTKFQNVVHVAWWQNDTYTAEAILLTP